MSKKDIIKYEVWCFLESGEYFSIRIFDKRRDAISFAREYSGANAYVDQVRSHQDGYRKIRTVTFTR